MPEPRNSTNWMLPEARDPSTIEATVGPVQGLGSWLADRTPGYLAGRAADISVMEEALTVSDFLVIKRTAHDMKGSGASYGFQRITEIGSLLELGAMSGDHAGIKTLLKELRHFLGEANNNLGAEHRNGNGSSACTCRE